MKLETIKNAVRYCWPIGIILALILALGIALFSPSASAQMRTIHYGWHATRVMHVYVGSMPYATPYVVGGVIAGSMMYAPMHPWGYNPYYVTPAWSIVTVQVYDSNCGCYTLVKQYRDQWGNTRSYP